jgi:ABC-type hemin transport system ATPase subunit
MRQDTDATSSLTVLEVVLLGRLGTLGMRLPPNLVKKTTVAIDAFGLIEMQYRTLNEISGGRRQLVYLAQFYFARQVHCCWMSRLLRWIFDISCWFLNVSDLARATVVHVSRSRCMT